MKILVFIFNIFLVSSICAQIPNTSLVEVLANPKKFHGKTIKFHGVVNIAFEENAVYLSKEHRVHKVTSCGLWLELTPEISEKIKWSDGMYCYIEGVFDASNNGHMGLWRGSVSKISMVAVYEAVKHPPFFSVD